MDRRVAWLAVVVLCVAARAAFAQQPGEALCGDCSTTGRVAHPQDASALEHEKGAKYCSVFMDADRDALGLDWMPCPKCLTPSLQQRAKREFDGLYGARKQWLDGRRAEVDERVGHEVLHCETEHFVIAWSIPKIKVGRAIVREHDAMHLYAERMETLHRQIRELFGITERDFSARRYYLYFFESLKDANTIATHVHNTSSSSSGRHSLYGGTESRYTTYLDAKTYRDDEAFHQSVVHSVSHLIFDHVRAKQVWLNERYGWVHEGLAHYMEIRYFGAPNTWCSREQGNFVHWKGTSWEANIKKAVLAGDHPSFQEVLKKPSDALDSMEHQFAWSWIDYLMWLDPKKMDDMLGMMKGNRVETRDALRDAYGVTIGQFVEGWEQFVRDQYSTRPNDGPVERAPRGAPAGG